LALVQASATFATARFGDFEVDLRQELVRRNGEAVSLQEKPLKILLALVEKPGELVTRQELCSKLWPADTYGAFEDGLNTAVRKLRIALNDSAEIPKFIETVPKRGYRFIAPIQFISAPNRTVSTSAHQPLPSPLSTPVEFSPEPKSINREWLPKVAIAGLLTLVVVALVFLGWRIWKPKTTSATVHAIALLPLNNLSGDPSQEYLTDGVTDELITELSQATGVPVVSRTSTMMYKNKQKSMQQIARELGVDTVVEGTLSKEGSHLKMTLHMIDGASDKSLWAREYEGEMSHVRELEIRAAGDLADRLRTSGQKRVAPDNPRPVAAEAYEEYLKGQTALLSDGNVALRHFERAAAIQPDYAAAYGGIAKTLVVLEANGQIRPFDAFPRITAAAEKALSIDKQTTDAHMALANTILNRDWNWSASEAETLRAIASHPNDAYVYRWYAMKLEWHGDLAKALDQARLALKLDPVSQNTLQYYAHLLEKNGNLKEALEQYQLAHEMNPNYGLPNFASALNKSGQPDRAAAEFVQFCLSPQHQPEIAAEFKRQYPVLGYEKAEAAAMRSLILRWLERMQQQSAKNEYASPGAYAQIYAQLQNREETLRYLDQAYREHSPVVLGLKDPIYDFIRDDPRFDNIYRSIPFYR
jgi:TolB-like protein/DNA-binding winged helix-turn-helix (wHTH) protein/tetratricopeptide (TPR) repeat protein